MLQSKRDTGRKTGKGLAEKFDTLPGTMLTLIKGGSSKLAVAVAQLMLTMHVYDRVRSDGGSKQRYTHALAVCGAILL